LTALSAAHPRTRRILTVEIQSEHEVVQARQRARLIAQSLGFDSQDQTRIATATSEIARNAYQYASQGSVEFALAPCSQTGDYALSVTVRDRGRGIFDLDAILDGQYASPTGMGLGIVGTRRLMDSFEIQSSAEGTQIRFQKALPRKSPTALTQALGRVAEALSRQAPETPLQEIRWQNQELLRAMDELRSSQAKLHDANQALEATNRELDETNRGVVALYTELEEKAADLRRANEVKSRFLSYLSHEFRTPINSILGLSRLLRERADGDLTPEQEKQVGFIQRAAQDVLDMANDLLDLGKVEAGKLDVRPKAFEVADLFTGLRGLMRPLLTNPAVELVIEDPWGIRPLVSDDGKLSQILRNLVSNALKFTEQGMVRVTAEPRGDEMVRFAVSDTGIGIPQDSIGKLFDEYSQIDSPLQRKLNGTGLGLSLVKKFAELLGGMVEVQSEAGKGSTFSVLIPRVYREAEPLPPLPASAQTQGPDPLRVPVLVIEDNPRTRATYRDWLSRTRFQPIEAAGFAGACDALSRVRPAAIVLDIVIPGERPMWPLLERIKADPKLSSIPVIVATASDDQGQARQLGAEAYLRKPLSSASLLERLEALAPRAETELALVVDDDEISRYLVRAFLDETRFATLEACNGREGLAIAKARKPKLIFLDLLMPELNGLETLHALKSDPETREIPVIVRSSQVLSPEERAELLSSAHALLPKDESDPHVRHEQLRSAILSALNPTAAVPQALAAGLTRAHDAPSSPTAPPKESYGNDP
jgi:signal transduction histidine kinase/CheY-like chemotaxis protein